jgi:hypothetical protein
MSIFSAASVIPRMYIQSYAIVLKQIFKLESLLETGADLHQTPSDIALPALVGGDWPSRDIYI